MNPFRRKERPLERYVDGYLDTVRPQNVSEAKNPLSRAQLRKLKSLLAKASIAGIRGEHMAQVRTGTLRELERQGYDVEGL